MSKVTAKFLVTGIAETNVDNGKAVTLRPVHSADPAHENTSWSKFTPSGHINLVITNPNASDAFEVGSEYLVEFTKVTNAAPAVDEPETDTNPDSTSDGDTSDGTSADDAPVKKRRS